MGRGFPQLVVLISIVTFLFDRLIAFELCSCQKKHPQTMFCEADFGELKAKGATCFSRSASLPKNGSTEAGGGLFRNNKGLCDK